MDLKEASAKAKQIMQEYLPDDWKFKFDNAKERFGRCSYLKRTISLSKHLVLLNDEERVTNTILHEVAHAMSGNAAGHGRIWRHTAKSLGCDARRCYSVSNTVYVEEKYIGTCPTCGKHIKRHRRNRIACSNCCNGVFDRKHLFVWSLNE